MCLYTLSESFIELSIDFYGIFSKFCCISIRQKSEQCVQSTIIGRIHPYFSIAWLVIWITSSLELTETDSWLFTDCPWSALMWHPFQCLSWMVSYVMLLLYCAFNECKFKLHFHFKNTEDFAFSRESFRSQVSLWIRSGLDDVVNWVALCSSELNTSK